jgi:hypothetical protein
MTQKEVLRRNNMAYLLAGIVFTALGIYRLKTGDSSVGSLFTLAGIIFMLQIFMDKINEGRRGGKKPPQDRRDERRP